MRLGSLLVLFFLGLPLALMAVDSPGEDQAVVVLGAIGATAPTGLWSKPARKESRERQEQVQGTKARERFEAETVIKSKYMVDGKSIDVDPD